MIMGGGISGMVGAFRLDGSKHMTTRTAPGADIEWTRTSSETPMQSAAASQVMPAQIQWPLGDLPAIAQRATAYVRSKWQPDAFLTSIQLEQTSGFTNAQSPDGGVMVQFLFYSPGQQLTLTYMPNSSAGELMPGGSADPSDERALPANFVDLPAAVAKLRAKGMRGVHVKSAHLENYGRGSYVGGGIGVFGPEWDIKSASTRRVWCWPSCPIKTTRDLPVRPGGRRRSSRQPDPRRYRGSAKQPRAGLLPNISVGPKLPLEQRRQRADHSVDD